MTLIRYPYVTLLVVIPGSVSDDVITEPQTYRPDPRFRFWLCNVSKCKASVTLGDFIHRSPRSAKVARSAWYSDCNFRRSAYKIGDISACQISEIKFASVIRLVCPFPRFFTFIAANRQWSQPIRLGDSITWVFKTATSPRSAKKNARCVRISRWRKSLAIFADDQVRRDRRIESPRVSLA